MILGSSSRADMTSCTLSNNRASLVQPTVPGRQWGLDDGRCSRASLRHRANVMLARRCCSVVVWPNLWLWKHAAVGWKHADSQDGCVQDGGAMVLWGSSRADMTSCTLSNNRASKVQRTVPGRQWGLDDGRCSRAWMWHRDNVVLARRCCLVVVWPNLWLR